MEIKYTDKEKIFMLRNVLLATKNDYEIMLQFVGDIGLEKTSIDLKQSLDFINKMLVATED